MSYELHLLRLLFANRLYVVIINNVGLYKFPRLMVGLVSFDCKIPCKYMDVFHKVLKSAQRVDSVAFFRTLNSYSPVTDYS